MNIDVPLDDLVRASRASRNPSPKTEQQPSDGHSEHDHPMSHHKHSHRHAKTWSADLKGGRRMRPPIVVRDPATGETRFVGGRTAASGISGSDRTNHARFSKPRRPIVVRCPRTGNTRIVGAPSNHRGSDTAGRNVNHRASSRDGRRYGDGSGHGGTGSYHMNSRHKFSSPGVRDKPIAKRTYRSGAFGSGHLEPKILISNLDPNVNNSDIYELFSKIGTLVRALVLFDKDHNHTGSAEVTFQTMDHALEAIKRYNGVPLDERPLQITLSSNGSSASCVRAPYFNDGAHMQ